MSVNRWIQLKITFFLSLLIFSYQKKSLQNTFILYTQITYYKCILEHIIKIFLQITAERSPLSPCMIAHQARNSLCCLCPRTAPSSCGSLTPVLHEMNLIERIVGQIFCILSKCSLQEQCQYGWSCLVKELDSNAPQIFSSAWATGCFLTFYLNH